MALKKLPKEFVGESGRISIEDFCELGATQRQVIVEMVEMGILEPTGDCVNVWEFTLWELQRFKKAQRLINDLDMNLSGVALSLELLDELKALRQYVSFLEQQLRLLHKIKA